MAGSVEEDASHAPLPVVYCVRINLSQPRVYHMFSGNPPKLDDKDALGVNWSRESHQLLSCLPPESPHLASRERICFKAYEI
ncbi:hypothetical protein PROFUN_04245 [Planoprotostelium fungivorum]|uniref:Uncharacterized protein n=1 Tax=Planoprotostelium fungivorum TaxID=1890364 RepID=A0A2P6NUY0_9EUKA|nr:hypothetical protein PROFUN_04245 [Planoprotostelium fungivorum]